MVTQGGAQPTRSASIQSSSERAPLLSPSQRSRNIGTGGSERNKTSQGGLWQRVFSSGGARDSHGQSPEDGNEHSEDDEDEYPVWRRRAPRTPRNLIAALFVLLALLMAGVIVAVVLQEYNDRKNPRWGTGRPYSPVLASGTHGAVAAEEARCSHIGVDVLKQNGTAVDAAIASTFCTGVVNMFSSGIGGGGFMIVRDPRPCSKAEKKQGLVECSTKKVVDFRETAPSGASPRMFEGRPMAARWGGLAVGVPGEIRGLEEAHKRWGRLPWHRLVAPSIRLAEGTYVSKELASRLKRFGFFFEGDTDWASTFVNPDTGMLLSAGDRIYRPALAKVLTAVANNGSRAFYESEYATAIVSKVQERGGVLTLDDMATYKAVVREAAAGVWQDRRVFTTPAPTSGPVLLSMLQVLSLYKNWIRDGIQSGVNMHRLIESMKFASAQRTRIGDPAFMNTTALDSIEEIMTLKEAKRLHTRIDDDRTYDIDYYEPLFDVHENHGTMHLSTLDRDGMAVALTSTVNLPFGSAVLDPATGVILNDEMDDSSTPGVPNAFGLYPSPYNYPEPGKRPLSSTAPTIVEEADGRFFITLGGAGGSRIFGSVAQVLLNIDWGLDVSAAIEHPRLHHQLLPTFVSAESTVDPRTVKALESRGHEVQLIDINMQVAEVQAILAKGDIHTKQRRIYAASDSRKGAIAVAY